MVTDNRRGKSDFNPTTTVSKDTAMRQAGGAEGNSDMRPSTAVTALKRILDIMVGLAGTAAFLIAYPILALLIKLESPGSAVYSQSRVGMDKRSRLGNLADTRRGTDVGGKPFTIYKFRTMRSDAEKNGPQLCGKGGDPRVTRLGRILRSTHLDELPQFWNVLKGEMSFIGPRPERPHFTVRYFKEIPQYRERTRYVKPGITGLSQIVLGYDDSLESVVRKTHFDLAYRASLSSLAAWLRLEFWVMFNTVKYLLNRGPLTEAARPPVLTVPDLESLGRPRMAMVRHRGTLKPTLVLAGAPAAKPVANFFTVDVECWFHAHNLHMPRSAWEGSRTRVVENVHRLLELLAVHDSKATFFVLGWVADRFPEVVRMIDIAGHEIGTHGYYHEKVTDLTPFQFEKDLDMSLNALSRHTSQRIVGHRASNFSIVESTMWALEILARYGIEYDSSIFPVKRKRYGIPSYPNRLPHVIHLGGGASIREVPLSVADIGGKAFPISGGGYLRLYPHALTDLYIRRQNGQGRPAMLYLHPWELDTEQKRVPAGLLESFQHYVNLDTTEWKLDRLLGRHDFTSIKENLESPNVQAMLARDPVNARISRPLPAMAEVEPGAHSHSRAVPREGMLAA
ncbi:MAG: polysaccharide deacetylase family protein locus subfamily [Fibrobacteres bacterium]|nr:polysaccharide deacetylase family protein locus subfamily [Fibrobacterota bacterium]